MTVCKSYSAKVNGQKNPSSPTSWLLRTACHCNATTLFFKESASGHESVLFISFSMGVMGAISRGVLRFVDVEDLSHGAKKFVSPISVGFCLRDFRTQSDFFQTLARFIGRKFICRNKIVSPNKCCFFLASTLLSEENKKVTSALKNTCSFAAKTTKCFFV